MLVKVLNFHKWSFLWIHLSPYYVNYTTQPTKWHLPAKFFQPLVNCLDSLDRILFTRKVLTFTETTIHLLCKDYSSYGWCSSTKKSEIDCLICFVYFVSRYFQTLLQSVLTLLKLTPQIRGALLSKNSEIICLFKHPKFVLWQNCIM